MEFQSPRTTRETRSSQSSRSRLLQHDHVLELRGPRSLTHAAAPAPHGEPRVASGEGTEEADGVFGLDYLRKHTNTSWMLQQRPLVERLQVERLCRGEDLRVSSL